MELLTLVPDLTIERWMNESKISPFALRSSSRSKLWYTALLKMVSLSRIAVSSLDGGVFLPVHSPKKRGGSSMTDALAKSPRLGRMKTVASAPSSKNGAVKKRFMIVDGWAQIFLV